MTDFNLAARAREGCNCENGKRRVSYAVDKTWPDGSKGKFWKHDRFVACEACQRLETAMRDVLQAAEDDVRELGAQQGDGEIDVGTPVDAFRVAADAIQRLCEGDIPPVSPDPSSGSVCPVARPQIVCLCGSWRFVAEMAVLAWTMEKEGAIVLGLHLLPAGYPAQADHQAEAEGIAEQMDELHKRKIDLADRILVVNIGGYIGNSTRSEIAYATDHGKPVGYIEAVAACGDEGEGGRE